MNGEDLLPLLGHHSDGCPCLICEARHVLRLQLELALTPREPQFPTLPSELGDQEALEFEENQRAFLGEGECKCLD